MLLLYNMKRNKQFGILDKDLITPEINQNRHKPKAYAYLQHIGRKKILFIKIPKQMVYLYLSET
jgi:hypothetical protein